MENSGDIATHSVDKEKLLSLGQYPGVSLAEARGLRDDAKASLRGGLDPSQIKKQKKLQAYQESTETFEIIAREWHDLQRPSWAPTHANDVMVTLDRDVFPYIGSTPIRQVTAPAVLSVIRKREGRDAKETARRVRQRISAICNFAIATARADLDPAASIRSVMAPSKRDDNPRSPILVKLGKF